MQQMKQRVFYLFMAILLALSGLLGVLSVLAPESNAQQFTVCYDEFGGAKRVAGSGCEYEFQSGATLDIQSGSTVTWDNVTVYPSARGATASVTNNTKIAHGLGTTPTAIILTPFYAGIFTQTVYISATNATSFTVGIETGSVTTATYMYWEAIK